MHSLRDYCLACKGRCKNKGKLKPLTDVITSRSRKGRPGVWPEIKKEKLPVAKLLLKEAKRLRAPLIITTNMEAWIRRSEM